MTRKQPQPEPPSGDGHAKAGQRPHREPGAAVTGHHADRPGDQRSGPNQAGLAWAASGGHDYTHRGPPPLPAWFYVLQGQPVPDDAPRTQPPPGFAELMAKRRSDSPDSDSPDSDSPDSDSPDSDSPDSDSPDSDSPDATPRQRQPRQRQPRQRQPRQRQRSAGARRAARHGAGGPADATAAPATEPAREPPGPPRRRPRPARPATASTPEPVPTAGAPAPLAPEAQWCGKCGYRADAPGHKMTCLGQT